MLGRVKCEWEVTGSSGTHGMRSRQIRWDLDRLEMAGLIFEREMERVGVLRGDSWKLSKVGEGGVESGAGYLNGES